MNIICNKSKAIRTFLVFTLLQFSDFCSDLQAETKSSEDFIKKAEERTEQVGVKIGMKKEEVMKILGPDYVEEKLKDVNTSDYVYSWHKQNGDFVSVTFSQDKVKAVSHMLHVEPTISK